ncbi:MAG: hypothetical protein RL681_18 [Candidatus Parcubacteria bacterium]
MQRGRSRRTSGKEQHLAHVLQKVEDPKKLDRLFKAAGGRGMPVTKLNVFMQEYVRRERTLPE